MRETNLVAKTELLLAELHAPPETLGDAIALLVELASELEADAAETRSALAVNAQTRSDLTDDRAKVARLQAGRRGERAARGGHILVQPSASPAHVTKCFVCSLSVHGVADPDDRMPRFLDGLDMRRQM